MQLKIRHKMTFDYPDMLGVQISRSNRKNKTMLKSFHGGKQGLPIQMVHSIRSGNEKQIKSMVETKIQQLHQKMKLFFSSERRTHLEQIAPEMQELKRSISQLKQQLSRPKSTTQIQQEKHELMKKKIVLLKDIQGINAQLKENGQLFWNLKFERQELQRELQNGKLTIGKYKKKLQDNSLIHNETQFLKQQDENKSTSKGQQTDSDKEKFGYKQVKDQKTTFFLNQSLCQQGEQVLKEQLPKNIKQKQAKNNSDHIVHVTQVAQRSASLTKKSPSGTKLPLLVNRRHLTHLSNYSDQLNSSINTLNDVKNYHTLVNPSPFLKKGLKKSGMLTGNRCTVLKSEESNSKISDGKMSFDEYMDSERHLQGNWIKKDIKRKKYALDMTMEIEKYEQYLNKHKWTQISQLYDQLQNQSPSQAISETSSESGSTSLHISQLSQTLMEQLRRYQFSLYKQKGYHEGLKDKTHQIKVEMKRLFKHYDSNAFFEEIIKKKVVKKELNKILDSLAC